MEVEIKNISTNGLPAYQTAGTAGVDPRANLSEGVIRLAPLARMLVPIGLYLEVPDGYEAQMRPHNGLSIRHGIMVINAPGTTDCDHRGEVKVPIANLSNETFEIVHGDRIAQMVLARYEQTSFEEASVLSKTERGVGGFGNTGNQ